MLNNFFTIQKTAEYLNKEISGNAITEIYSQEKNKLIIDTSVASANDEDQAFSRSILEFSIDRNFNYLIVKNNFSKAKKNFVNLFEEIYGMRIASVQQYNNDRVISFKLEDDLKLLFTFFGNSANMFLTDNSVIKNSYKDKSNFAGVDISDVLPVRNVIDEIPGNIPVEKYIKLIYPQYGKFYNEEALSIAGIDSNSNLTEEVKGKIESGFKRLSERISQPEFILYDDRIVMSLIKLHNQYGKHREFKNINDLITEYIRLKAKSEKHVSVREKKLDELDHKISTIETKIKGLQSQLNLGERTDELKKSGEAILANLDSISKGDTDFSYIDNAGINQSIKLKPDLTPVENAQLYFDRSKKQKNSFQLLESKIAALHNEKKKFEEEIERIKNMKDTKELIKEVSKTEGSKPDETSRFRKFRLNEKYEVWVGKDSASNDQLTTKFSAPNDLWFHVRGASGSHTVLKVSNKKDPVPKEMIHKAASVAAYYSKARKASSVPVAYTERKYVKKKKGFKEGSVIMEREKVIFVKPELFVISNRRS